MVHENDFTDDQWRRLAEGEKPIAAYDTRSRTLTILRNPIRETVRIFRETLERIDNLLE